MIAATNHIGVLDAVLTRLGRFTEHIEIPLPEELSLSKMLHLNMKGVENKLTAGNLQTLQKRLTVFQELICLI